MGVDFKRRNNMSVCPFCALDHIKFRFENDLIFTIEDAFPVSPGHTLIIVKRHVASFFETTDEERGALLDALIREKARLKNEFSPDGFNIGINDGYAAGQTIPHLHTHLIPRYKGDMADPRGGIRLIFPEKAAYWKD